ncbi:MAG: nitrous oxide-stimulated promoter family protein [Candidatus Hodarchaeales archaeon]
MSRLNRERRTMELMINLYCKDHHGSSSRNCQECSDLVSYANFRLDKCRFGEDKPTCSNCPVHCYKKDMRAKIRKVMRYSGPKMIFRHRSHLVRQTWTFIQERLSCNYHPGYGTGETEVPPETVGRCPAF